MHVPVPVESTASEDREDVRGGGMGVGVLGREGGISSAPTDSA